MEYSQKPVMNVAPSSMHMPLSMPNPAAPISSMPFPNMAAPISTMPIMKPGHGPVSVHFAGEHCFPKSPAFSSTGVILVLFILLVIISRAKC